MENLAHAHALALALPCPSLPALSYPVLCILEADGDVLSFVFLPFCLPGHESCMSLTSLYVGSLSYIACSLYSSVSK